MRAKKFSMDCETCKQRLGSTLCHVQPEHLKGVNYNKTCAVYKKGQIVFHEDANPSGVYCIYTGKLKIYKIGDDGKEQIISIAQGGDMLGYRAIISNERYPVTAEALEEVQLCIIPRSEFERLMTESTDFSNEILREACSELGEMTKYITNLAQKSVRQRLAVTLLKLKDIYQVPDENGEEGHINLTREDLANYVGTATETVIRLLHDFKEEQLVATQGRKIQVIDAQKMVKVANIF
jgi:CRP/FNR family transcriptional regulator